MPRGHSKISKYGGGFLAVVVAGFMFGAVQVRAEQTTWLFDSLERIGGLVPRVDGDPQVMRTPVGSAIEFDGDDDALYFSTRPLVGARAFTIEFLVRPDGGASQQRFMHIAEADPATGIATEYYHRRLPDIPDPFPRFMFEMRIVENGWYPTAMANSSAGQRALNFPEKIFPLGRWYSVAQTFDGTRYRLYVDGVLLGEDTLVFTPHGPGPTMVGARMNQVDYFKGAIARARFTDRALSPDEMMKIPI